MPDVATVPETVFRLEEEQFAILQRTIVFAIVMGGMLYSRPNASLTMANMKTIFDAADLTLEKVNEG